MLLYRTIFCIIRSKRNLFFMQDNQKLKLFEYTIDYHMGALWWGAENLIKSSFEHWHENDRKGHPLLSLRKTKISAMHDIIPMLVGTSIDDRNKKHIHLPIQVQPNRHRITDFGTQVESHLISATDFMYHDDSEKIKNNPLTPVWQRRKLWPNFDKLHITKAEEELLLKFLSERKKVALEQGGYNQ